MARPLQSERLSLRTCFRISGISLALVFIAHGLASAQDSGASYTVQPGDTLSSIALDAAVTVEDLASLNGLSDPDAISIGQSLVLRVPEAAPLPTTAYTYMVQEGDTLYSIARLHGMAVDKLAELNGLSDPNLLVVGRELRIEEDSARAPTLLMAAAQPSQSPTATQTPVVASATPPRSPSPSASQGSATPTPRANTATTSPTPTATRAPTGAPLARPAPTGPGKWLDSPNFWPGRPAGQPIAVVLHTAAGTLSGMDTWFANPDSQSSSHYGIGLGGEIHQYVRLEDRSWTNGILEAANHWPGPATVQPNELTVNIETEDRGLEQMLVTDEQYQSTVQVGWAIVARYPSIRYLMTHRSLNPGTRANDPGPRWLESGRFSALARDLQLTAVP